MRPPFAALFAVGSLPDNPRAVPVPFEAVLPGVRRPDFGVVARAAVAADDPNFGDLLDRQTERVPEVDPDVRSAAA